MFRRHNRWWSRFDQPDPYDGSYDLANPQSFNRYAYVQNDPVNFIDPAGLENCNPGDVCFIFPPTEGNGGVGGLFGTGGGLTTVNPPIGEGGAGITQNSTFDIPGITKLVNQELADPDCAKFAQTILDQLSNGKGGNLADVFNAFLNQPKAHDLFTRTAPSGSRGQATGIGSLKNSTAAMFLRKDPNQTVLDANGVIAELFHFAGAPYSDKDLAKALIKTSYAGEAALVFPDGTANIFDKKNYRPNGWSDADGYSTYFHGIQQRHCGTVPANTYKNT
jgi:hypothetical protein